MAAPPPSQPSAASRSSANVGDCLRKLAPQFPARRSCAGRSSGQTRSSGRLESSSSRALIVRSVAVTAAHEPDVDGGEDDDDNTNDDTGAPKIHLNLSIGLRIVLLRGSR